VVCGMWYPSGRMWYVVRGRLWYMVVSGMWYEELYGMWYLSSPLP